ncbi:MAG: DUF2971 domain-containing protein [Ruminococcus sp.]|nr:DUF2971 domain-containing protein [Ruminococcus sp.]
MNNNDYLYHYTSVEILALILKNRSIRFNSLDKMDDLQEQETSDLRNIGQFIYISSWTDDETESIPMWNMYASLDRGVRIRLKKNPFKLYENTAESLSGISRSSIIDTSQGKSLKSMIPLYDIFSKGFFTNQAINPELLFQVEYTSDKDKLYPKMLTSDDNHFAIRLGDLGKHKNLHWEFQKEWRYVMEIIPFNLNQSPEAMFKEFIVLANNIRSGTAKQPFPYYDMFLDDEAFADMQITLSPRIGAGSRVIVQDLIEKYNPSADLKDSCLLGLI